MARKLAALAGIALLRAFISSRPENRQEDTLDVEAVLADIDSSQAHECGELDQASDEAPSGTPSKQIEAGELMDIGQGSRLVWGSPSLPFSEEGGKLGIKVEVAVWRWIVREGIQKFDITEKIACTIQKQITDQGIDATVTTNAGKCFVTIPEEKRAEELQEIKRTGLLGKGLGLLKFVAKTVAVVGTVVPGQAARKARSQVMNWVKGVRAEYALPLFIEIRGITDYDKLAQNALGPIAQSVFKLLNDGVCIEEEDSEGVCQVDAGKPVYAVNPEGNEIRPLEDTLKEHPLLGSCLKGTSLAFQEGTEEEPNQIILKVEFWKNDLLKEFAVMQVKKDGSELTEGEADAGRTGKKILGSKKLNKAAQKLIGWRTAVVKGIAESVEKVKKEAAEGVVMAAKQLGVGKSQLLAGKVREAITEQLIKKIEDNGINVEVEKPGETETMHVNVTGGALGSETYNSWTGEAFDPDKKKKHWATGEPKTRHYVGVRFVISLTGLNKHFAETKLVQLRQGVLKQLMEALPQSQLAKVADVVSVTPCGWQTVNDLEAPHPHDAELCAPPPNCER